jgi:hypothetical protein
VPHWHCSFSNLKLLRGELVNMPRTKQTAKRSTGGPAPLQSLSLVLEPTTPGNVTVATLPAPVPASIPLSGATATRSTTASRRKTRVVDEHAHVSSEPTRAAG